MDKNIIKNVIHFGTLTAGDVVSLNGDRWKVNSMVIDINDETKLPEKMHISMTNLYTWTQETKDCVPEDTKKC